MASSQHIVVTAQHNAPLTPDLQTSRALIRWCLQDDRVGLRPFQTESERAIREMMARDGGALTTWGEAVDSERYQATLLLGSKRAFIQAWPGWIDAMPDVVQLSPTLQVSEVLDDQESNRSLVVVVAPDAFQTTL